MKFFAVLTGILLCQLESTISSDSTILELNPIQGQLGKPLRLSYSDRLRAISFCTWYRTNARNESITNHPRLHGSVTGRNSLECGYTISNLTSEHLSTWEFIIVFKFQDSLTLESGLTLKGRVNVTAMEPEFRHDWKDPVLSQVVITITGVTNGQQQPGVLKIVEGYTTGINITCCVFNKPFSDIRLNFGNSTLSAQQTADSNSFCIRWQFLNFTWRDHNKQIQCISDGFGVNVLQEFVLVQVYYQPKIIDSNQNGSVIEGLMHAERIGVKFSGNPRPTVSWVVTKASDPSYEYSQGTNFQIDEPIKVSENIWETVLWTKGILSQMKNSRKVLNDDNVLCRLVLKNQMGVTESRFYVWNKMDTNFGRNVNSEPYFVGFYTSILVLINSLHS